eukprot:gnl/MRDRNA2_/MRDRNA2_30187_c0_seq1.p1 gnl/MRDRNA2_/MRDRNA2_30187_c0~~gnl/MRDRNA2_/MRDRNA2_30187_c0_seq1.p1  ORF type:complete len:104 (-),score=29.18 gnl/MRDRNA2_/MRDRNA2_30187_c0_seq1:132-443(-)
MRPPGWRPLAFPPSGSNKTEALLDKWVEAKRAKDFEQADMIRDDLKNQGINADDMRPDRKTLLDQWVEAKRARNFWRSDQLREALWAQGIDPEEQRPAKREKK